MHSITTHVSNDRRVGFVGIGAQKSATTWLYDILRDHPQVGLSRTKEVDFFSRCYDHGFQWYENHFDKSRGTLLHGEISPSYLSDPSAPSRLVAYAPDAKLLISLREPIDRAVSNHRHEVRVGHFSGDDLSFEAGLANNPTYIEQGLYATQLKRWLEHFPSQQCLIVLFDDIKRDPMGVARRVYTFLDIDPEHHPSALGECSNIGHVKRWQWLHHGRRSMRLFVARLGLAWFWDLVAKGGLRKLYRRWNWLPAEAVLPAPTAETIRALRMRFHPELIELEQLTGHSLAHWRQPSEEHRPEQATPSRLQELGVADY